MKSKRFPLTQQALKDYDELSPMLDAELGRADTDEQVAHWLKSEAVAIKVVQFAFWQDTKHINSQDHCKVVSISHLRELVAKDIASSADISQS